MAFGFAFTPVHSAIAVAWGPGSFFSNNEQGVWYDPSDFSTMYQDAAGTTPVTAVEQPVGKILDKSGRGNHAIQATTTKRPRLKQDGNGKYYLLFDGVDDALSTGSIDFTSTDKMTVVAGVRKLSDTLPSTYQCVIELSDSALNTGIFTVFSPYEVAGSIRFTTKGTTPSSLMSTTNPAPSTFVLTGIGSISTDVATLRINGIQAATNTADQGTGNYGNYPLYIGSRGGTSLPFNGHLYSLIVRGAQSTDAQIVAAESYVNGKTGAY